MDKTFTLALSLVVLPFIIIALKAAFTPLVPLISRNVFFGNPEKCMVRISPDGKYITYLAALDAADEKSVLNIWIRSIDKQDDLALTASKDRSIQSYFWSNDSKELLYLKDDKGNENHQLFSVNIENKQIIPHSPFENVKVMPIPHNNKTTSKLLLAMNKENVELFDVYELDLKDKSLKLHCKNPGNVISWIPDSKVTIRAAYRTTEDGGGQFMIRHVQEDTKKDKQNHQEWEIIREYTAEETQGNIHPFGFTDDGFLYVSDSKDNDTAHVQRYNTKSKQWEKIALDNEFDIIGGFIHPETQQLEAVNCEKAKSEWCILKNGVCKRILEAFNNKHQGNISLVDSDSRFKLWIIALDSDVCPPTYYLYNDETGSIEELYKSQPKLRQEDLASVEPFKIQSRDGLTLHGYLTFPKGSDRKKLPMVLMVHGGPNLRDSWNFDAKRQWLANRGFIVMQVNYRGSTGFGKAFIRAAHKEWGGKMHDDLIDSVNWAIKEQIADPSKIAIFGGSYGGYAALVGATFTPDVFCCAVDIVGPSNLITLLNSIPPYWKVFREKNNISIGNPDTEAEFLKSRSPLFFVHAIKIPLLIAQGAHDPRVKQAESEQIVEALKNNGIPHEYLLFLDEGHGFANAHNRLKFYAHAEAFLAKHLGGRCEK